jgi:hypothetical protein
MDTSKWKSMIVPLSVYQQIRAIATMERRTLSGQIRLIFDEWKEYRMNEARRLDNQDARVRKSDDQFS